MATKEATDKAASFSDLDREMTKILGPESDPRVRFWLPTGVTLLDWALANGLPGGRVVEIYGKESSGKTLLALSICRQALRRGGMVLWMDAEARLSVTLATHLVKANISERFRYSIPDNLQAALMAIEKAAVLCRHNKTPVVIVLDSLAALEDENEDIDHKQLDESKSKLGTPGLMSKFFRRGVIRKIAGSNVHILLLNQVRDKVNMGWVPPGAEKETTPGGRALAFYASTRLIISQKAMQATDKDVGTMIQVYIKKSSTGPPGRTIQVPFYFVGQLRGLQDGLSLLNFLIAKGILKKLKKKDGSASGFFSFEGEDVGRKLQVYKRLVSDEGFARRVMAKCKAAF